MFGARGKSLRKRVSLQRKLNAFDLTRLVVGAGFSIVLMALVGPMLIGVSLLLLCGLPIYVLFSPKKELHDLKGAFFSREAILRRTYDQGERFLAYPWRRILWLSYRIRHGTKPWVVHEDREDNHPD